MNVMTSYDQFKSRIAICHPESFLPWTGFANGAACSHMRVLDLYIESIESTCVFNALPCESKEDFDGGQCDCKKNCQYTTMGYGSLPSDTGDFYLHTGSAKPFCLE